MQRHHSHDYFNHLYNAHYNANYNAHYATNNKHYTANNYHYLHARKRYVYSFSINGYGVAVYTYNFPKCISLSHSKSNTIYAIDMYFMKVKKKQCKKGTFGDDRLGETYKTLDQAMDVCKFLSNCVAVYDELCDNKDGFKICPSGSMTHATSDSCSYYKLGKNLSFSP